MHHFQATGFKGLGLLKSLSPPMCMIQGLEMKGYNE